MNNIEALFISDVHLGSKFSKSDELLKTLDQYKPNFLFIVGDFIDGWLLRNKPNLSKSNIEVLKKVLLLSKNNTQVYYIVGNHDEFLRIYGDMSLGNIKISNSVIWNDCYITHGDKFDSIILNNKWLSIIGSYGYELLLRINDMIQYFQKLFKLKPRSFSKYIKYKFKHSFDFINKFENRLIDEAIINNCNTVICGHIHTPNDKYINNIHYLNTGDWIENKSYIIFNNNKFEIRYAD